MTCRIHVTRKALDAVLLFTATYDIRYYLNGLRVEATGYATRVVGTNGHMLALHHRAHSNEVSEPTGLIVPRRAVELLQRARPARAKPARGKPAALEDIVIEHDGGRWWLHDRIVDVSIGFVPIEGKYPDYMKSVPAKVSGERAHFNSGYVGTMARAAKVFNRAPQEVLIEHNGPNAAALVRLRGVDEFVALLMPMRPYENELPPERPAWLAESLAPPPKPTPAPTDEAVAA